MPIKVAHEISGKTLGDASYASGQAQGQERRREQDRSYQQQQELNALRERARQDANAQFYAQLQAQTQARDQEMAFSQKQYDELPGRQQELGQIENDLRKDLSEYEYSRTQQQQLEKLAQARDFVQRNVDGRYTPAEQENLLRQIDEMQHGIKPQRKPNTPWPKEQDVGQIWIDQNSGATLTRDTDGNVKMLVKPDDSGSFANQIKLKEQIAKYTKDIFESRQMSENPVSWQEATDIAQQFYGDIGKANKNQPADKEEFMADMMLQQIMSPETYKAAKASGLPSKDIFYMAQQLANQGNTPANETNGDISKSEWMKNDQNFNKYRERFASGMPQNQMEEVYKNDPFVDINNSAMQDPNHNVTTPYAAWQELTDHQREKAYKKYIAGSKMPLGDRFGMAVSKVLSKEDYKNYKSKEKAHKDKLLTQEQFAQKCKDDPDFLWQFIKAPNRTSPVKIDQTQVNTHRAIDSQRTLFGGLR